MIVPIQNDILRDTMVYLIFMHFQTHPCFTEFIQQDFQNMCKDSEMIWLF